MICTIFKDISLEDQINVMRRYEIYNEHRNKVLSLKKK